MAANPDRPAFRVPGYKGAITIDSSGANISSINIGPPRLERGGKEYDEGLTIIHRDLSGNLARIDVIPQSRVCITESAPKPAVIEIKQYPAGRYGNISFFTEGQFKEDPFLIPESR